MMTTFEKIKKAAIARLEAGEPIEIILQDYADYADELRPFLASETGISFGELVSNSPQQYAQVKPKRTSKSGNNTIIFLTLGISLVTLIVLGAFSFIRIDSSTISPPLAQPSGTDTCMSLPPIQPLIQSSAQNTNSNNDYDGYGAPDDAAAEPGYALESVGAPVAMRGEGADGALGGVASTTSEGEIAVMPTMRPADASADTTADTDEETRTSSIPPAPSGVVVQQEPMRAGEIDDNVDWDAYQAYRNDYLNQHGMDSVRDIDTTDRQIIQVIDRNGLPVLGACVQIYNGETFVTGSRTYATGMTLFFPNMNKLTRYVDTFRVVVTSNGHTVETEMQRQSLTDLTVVELDLSQQIQSQTLDVLFLLDATGSMADEIAQLQQNILSISSQIDNLPANVDARYGLVAYRDRGDAYVTRVWDFTSDVVEFHRSLAMVQAGGGGDYPESMNEGLYRAINDVSWRGSDTVQLVFLVADAPPHIDYANDADYSLLIQDALIRGIKIHPLASSGLQPEGEFIMRQIGQYTMGHFIFLTYDDGVAGTVGDDRPDLHVGDAEDEQGIGDYTVAQLDELVLRLITDELAARQPE